MLGEHGQFSGTTREGPIRSTWPTSTSQASAITGVSTRRRPPPARISPAAPQAGTRTSLLRQTQRHLVIGCGRMQADGTRFDAAAAASDAPRNALQSLKHSHSSSLPFSAPADSDGGRGGGFDIAARRISPTTGLTSDRAANISYEKPGIPPGVFCAHRCAIRNG
jgi:hypothetical protein